MKLTDYLKDRILIILLNIFCQFLLYCYLKMTGNSTGAVTLILIVWLSVLVLYLTVSYLSRKHYFTKLETTLDTLDQKYLMAEVMDKPYRLEDKIYQGIIRESNKSVIEKINALEEEQKAYKEYIESWIHEVKIPITVMDLICTNNKNDITRKIQPELNRIDNYVEMALYYARSEAVYKDYLVKEIDVQSIIIEILGKNKQFFIQNHMTVETDFKEDKVFSDDKWLSFILNQILINAVKYKKSASGKISIRTDSVQGGIKLTVEDDGIGIRQSEIERIFDKGFTGTNGRNTERSTGIGLYLCKKLCTRLGIEIKAESEENSYTRIILFFPVGTYLSKL